MDNGLIHRELDSTVATLEHSYNGAALPIGLNWYGFVCGKAMGLNDNVGSGGQCSAPRSSSLSSACRLSQGYPGGEKERAEIAVLCRQLCNFAVQRKRTV
jgi:hypothetical protein